MKRKIGPYTISKLKNDNFLIFNEIGEGMEINDSVRGRILENYLNLEMEEKKAIKWLDKFWEEHF